MMESEERGRPGLLLSLFIVMTLTLPTVLGNSALLIIDVQNCFLPRGSLAVRDGEQVIPVINGIRRDYGDQFQMTVLTQDWHCPDHVSFASMHAGKSPQDVILLQYTANGTLCDSTTPCDVAYNVTQVLWPDHCVMNMNSAEFSQQLAREESDVIVRKGYNCDVDSYSGFYDNGGFTHTELDDVLRRNGITRIFVTGLALDYCVYYTSNDGIRLGYDTYIVVDASRPVSNVTMATALDDLRSKGVHLIDSEELERIFQTSVATHVTGSVTLVIMKVGIYAVISALS